MRARQALNSLSVTDFKDTGCTGSLINNLVTQQCLYYKNEGGSPYQGYDFYRSSVQQAVAAGLPVAQTNESDWVAFNGQHFGPVNSWSFAPPTGDPGRVLTCVALCPEPCSAGDLCLCSRQRYKPLTPLRFPARPVPTCSCAPHSLVTLRCIHQKACAHTLTCNPAAHHRVDTHLPS